MITKESYLKQIKDNNDRAVEAKHWYYENIVKKFTDRVALALQEGSTSVFMPYEARGGQVDNIIYSSKFDECLNKAKELYPWLDIELHYKPYGDMGCTLRVLND